MDITELRALPYNEYLKTHHWRTISRAARDHYGEACLLCGATRHTHVHHRTYDRRGEERIHDLTVLCARCHEHWHNEPSDVNIIRDAIVSHLSDGLPHSRWELDSTLEGHHKHIFVALHRLEEEGVIARTANGGYVLLSAHFNRLIDDEANEEAA